MRPEDTAPSIDPSLRNILHHSSQQRNCFHLWVHTPVPGSSVHMHKRFFLKECEMTTFSSFRKYHFAALGKISTSLFLNLIRSQCMMKVENKPIISLFRLNHSSSSQPIIFILPIFWLYTSSSSSSSRICQKTSPERKTQIQTSADETVRVRFEE